jgi:hypothetical protein
METLAQAWDNFFTEDPLDSFEQEFGLEDPSETGATLQGAVSGVGTTIGNSISAGLSSAASGLSTELVIVLVLVVVGLALIAYVTREAVG